MELTKLLCLLCFICVGHMARTAANTATATNEHDTLQYVQDLKEHVTRLEQRLNDQSMRILTQEQTIREQREDFRNRFSRQEKVFLSKITQQEQTISEQRKEFMNRFNKQEETIQEQKKNFIDRITQQEKTFMSRITRQEETIQEQRKEFKGQITQQEGIIQEQKKELMNRITQQEKEFVHRISQQEETIRALKKNCNWMRPRNKPPLHQKLSNSDPDQRGVTPEADFGSIQPQHTVARNENDTRKRSDDTSIGALEPVLSHVTAQITEMTADIQALKNTNTRHDQERGTTYMRWGHTGCPGSSELVYSGMIGGSHHNGAGGAANHLCLTSQPVFDGHVQPSGNYYTYIYGSEYEICPEAECNTTPACAVCRVSRFASVMIPGTNACSPGWTKEYSGYIMADHPDHSGSSEYICVDSSHKHALYSSQSNDGENVMYYTHTRCGALPCPPYQNDKIVTCVVCTK